MPKQIPVLNDGFVALRDHMADDLSVVNAARVSFAQSSDELDASGESLIGFLMREEHGSPFEHAVFRFHVRAPIFVVREWQRHRIASYNELSGRYAKLSPVFYEPYRDNVRTQVGKPGAYHFERLADDSVADEWLQRLFEWEQDGQDLYAWALANGIAKEQARFSLANTMYTEFYFTVNARALMHFLHLRNDPAAMYEIREYAVAMETIFSEVMPVTHRWFVEHGHVSP